MTDSRESLGWIIGSAIAGIAAFLSWFYESGLLSTLIGIVIGAGITYFVQTRTQKRVWKREYALRNTEMVYGPLFEYVEGILRYNVNEAVPQRVPFIKWDEIKKTYQYLMIDNDFRYRLDDFSGKIENYTKRFEDVVQFAQTIVIEEARIAYPSHKEVYPVFVITGNRHINTAESLIRQEHPYTSALKEKKDYETHEYEINLRPIKNGMVPSFRYEDAAKAIYDEMWNKCHERMEKSSEVQAMRKEYSEILKELRDIRKELTRRIQEPWKI
jgi:hypothetical protein